MDERNLDMRRGALGHFKPFSFLTTLALHQCGYEVKKKISFLPSICYVARVVPQLYPTQPPALTLTMKNPWPVNPNSSTPGKGPRQGVLLAHRVASPLSSPAFQSYDHLPGF
jgi:hypothetical protein